MERIVVPPREGWQIVSTLEVPKKPQLTLEKGSAIAFNSFKFSQGDLHLQRQILGYLHQHNPTFQIDDELREKIISNVKGQVRRFAHPKADVKLHNEGFGGSSHEADNFIDYGVTQTVWGMERIFNGKNETTKRDLTPDLFSGIVEKDYKNIVENREGRPRHHGGKKLHSPALDPMLSHLCFYGLEENLTGVEEYDQMFKAITAFALEFNSGQNRNLVEKPDLLLQKFSDVVQVYVNTHPNSRPLLQKLGMFEKE